MAKVRRSRERRQSASAENAKTPQRDTAGSSERRGPMFTALTSLRVALPVIISYLTAIKILIEVLQLLNNSK